VINTGAFRDIEGLVKENEIITGDKFFHFASISEGISYLKRDFLYKGGLWRGNHIAPLISRASEFRGSTLLIGHSDLPTKQIDMKILSFAGVSNVYAVNSRPLSNRLASLPLGITNDCDDSPIHRILGNESHFLSANDSFVAKDILFGSIYVNFTASNQSSIRKPLLEFIEQQIGLYAFTVERPEFSNSGRINYLQKLRSSSMVLCPEGNGIDTHRFWETLYMGGIPVVIANPSMDYFYDNLPVIKLGSWADLLDRENIHRLWVDLSLREYNFDILKRSFWESKIIDTAELSEL